MTIVKRFTSEQRLSEYLVSNRQYEVLVRVGIAGIVVLLTDKYQETSSAVEAVDVYIGNQHYEDSNIHYKAYYGEY